MPEPPVPNRATSLVEVVSLTTATGREGSTLRRPSVTDGIVEDAIRELEAEFDATEGAEFDQPKTSSGRAYRWHKWQLFVAAAGTRTGALKEESAPLRLGGANASDKHADLSIEWCRKSSSAGR